MTEGWVGLLGSPFLDPASRTFLPFLGTAFVVGAVFLWWSGRARSIGAAVRLALGIDAWRHRSTALDVQLLLARRAFVLIGGAASKLGVAWLFATSLVRVFDRLFGVPEPAAIPPVLLTVAASLVLFVAGDLSRYLLHRAMHEVAPLWQLHQVHHSAEVLTPLTHHRIHPLEGLLYEVRGALVSGAIGGALFWLSRGAATQWTFLGVAGIGVCFDAALGNLRHSHVWLPLGRLERFVISPAQHQMHHELGVTRCNYGTWLAWWDRWGGTWRPAGDAPPKAFGIADEERNHAPDDLLSVLLGPIRAALVAILAWATPAAGQEPAPPPDDADEEIVVTDEGGVPRVAGSAYEITEEELERYESNDIHQVLSRVPGVYVRVEDGFGLRPNIGIRGANSDRSSKITLLQDGLPIAPAPYAAPAAYYFPLVTRMVGVEVFKGPASLQHGPQTLGGAINLLTRDPPGAPAGQVDVSLGTHTYAKLHGWGGTGGDRWGILAEVAHVSTEGFKELPDGGPTGFARQDVRLAGRVGSAPGLATQHTLDLDLGYGREVSNETYLGLTLDDLESDPDQRYAASQDDRMEWHHTEASLAWKAAWGRTQVRTTAWHHFLDRTWSKLNGFASGVPDLHDLLQDPSGGQAEVYTSILRGETDSTTADQVLEIGTNDRRFHSGGLQSVLRTAFGGRVRDEIEVGLRAMADDVVRLHTGSPFDMTGGDLVPTGGPTATLLDSHTRAFAAAGWARDDLDLGRLHVVAGARGELISTRAVASDFQWVGLPGLGVYGDATRWLDLFTGVHRGFSPVAPGQPEGTKPETAINVEAGARAHPGETHAELVGYLSAIDDITGTCTFSSGCTDDEIDRQFNGGAALVGGIEVLIHQRIHLPERIDLSLGLTYTWTRARFQSAFASDFPQWGSVEVGDALPYVPEHQGGAEVVLEHPRLGSFGASAFARSGMWDVAGQGAIPEDTGIPALFVLDLAGHLRITNGVELYSTVTNATNTAALTSWRPYGARPMAPLQVDVGIKVGAE